MPHMRELQKEIIGGDAVDAVAVPPKFAFERYRTSEERQGENASNNKRMHRPSTENKSSDRRNDMDISMLLLVLVMRVNHSNSVLLQFC